MISPKWAVRAAYAALAILAALMIPLSLLLSSRDVKVVTKTVDRPVAPAFGTYDEVTATLGPGTPIAAEDVGAPAGSTCASWTPGDAVQVVSCRMP